VLVASEYTHAHTHTHTHGWLEYTFNAVLIERHTQTQTHTVHQRVETVLVVV
jgi:hypothetical protein